MSRRALGIGALAWSLTVLAVSRGAEDGEKNVYRDRGQPGMAASADRSLAILIGVQDYASLTKLKYCRADVQRLAEVLQKQCHFDKVIVMTEDAAENRYRPTLGNLLRELRIWLGVADSGGYARVLVYFSGHGFQDKQGRLYLAPPDCDRQNLSYTGLPISLVKQYLDVCKPQVKLASTFRAAKGLITLASCKPDEVSLEWDAKGQGLFTYFLAEGISGAADRDGDGIVDSDEAYRYLFDHVPTTGLRTLCHVSN